MIPFRDSLGWRCIVLTRADGGGIRGKSSLLILEKIMETIRDSERLESTPRPCEYFDLIGGTSTGGYGDTYIASQRLSLLLTNDLT